MVVILVSTEIWALYAQHSSFRHLPHPVIMQDGATGETTVVLYFSDPPVELSLDSVIILKQNGFKDRSAQPVIRER